MSNEESRAVFTVFAAVYFKVAISPSRSSQCLISPSKVTQGRRRPRGSIEDYYFLLTFTVVVTVAL